MRNFFRQRADKKNQVLYYLVCEFRHELTRRNVNRRTAGRANFFTVKIGSTRYSGRVLQIETTTKLSYHAPLLLEHVTPTPIRRLQFSLASTTTTADKGMLTMNSEWKLTANFCRQPEFAVSLFLLWSSKYCAEEIDLALANFFCTSWRSSSCNQEPTFMK